MQEPPVMCTCPPGSRLLEVPSPGWPTVPISTTRMLTLAIFRYEGFAPGGRVRASPALKQY